MSMKGHIEGLLAELSGPDENSRGRSDPEFTKDWIRRAKTAAVFAYIENLGKETTCG